MHRSTDHILTTHCGSLPRPRELLAPLHAKDSRLPHDRDALAAGVRRSVADVVRRQVETGIDVVNDGELSKSSFAHYARTRIGGLTVSDEPRLRLADTSRDAIAFPGVYEEMKVMFAARAALTKRPQGMSRLICTETGLLANPACPSTEIELFREGSEPTGYCNVHTGTAKPPTETPDFHETDTEAPPDERLKL